MVGHHDRCHPTGNRAGHPVHVPRPHRSPASPAAAGPNRRRSQEIHQRRLPGCVAPPYGLPGDSGGRRPHHPRAELVHIHVRHYAASRRGCAEAATDVSTHPRGQYWNYNHWITGCTGRVGAKVTGLITSGFLSSFIQHQRYFAVLSHSVHAQHSHTACEISRERNRQVPLVRVSVPVPDVFLPPHVGVRLVDGWLDRHVRRFNSTRFDFDFRAGCQANTAEATTLATRVLAVLEMASGTHEKFGPIRSSTSIGDQ